MGLTGDRRPRDWAYAVNFTKKELPSLQQMIRYVNETHDVQPIEDFNERCEQRLKERDAAVTKAEDLMTNPGLQALIDLGFQSTGTRFQYLEIGAGSTAATVSDTTLQSVI